MMQHGRFGGISGQSKLRAVSDQDLSVGRQGRKPRRPDPLLGATIADKYHIIDKLGEGGMGTVYRAIQKPIERLVAVKVLLNKLIDDDMAIRRFEQEARAVSKMQHPNTVTIYDYGQTNDGRFYLVMEFLKGKTLTDLLREVGPLDAQLTCHVIRQVCASLSDAHAAGIIHRDLKPDNIFLTVVGNDKNFVKVLDFGVAKLADSEAGATLTQTGMIFGTPKYMSPEQAEGKPLDFRADIYAIGVVMYELLTGRPPFLAETAVALLIKHISEPPPQFTKIRADLQVPAQLEAITMKALAKNVDQRYASAEELSHDLHQCMSLLSTGQMQMVGLVTQPVPAGGAMPTEVVPDQSVSGTEGLAPPQAVPANISLGVNPDHGRTGHSPVMGSGATHPSSLLNASTQAAYSPVTGSGVTHASAFLNASTQAGQVSGASTDQVLPGQTTKSTPVTGGAADSTVPTSPEALSPSNELFLDAARRPSHDSRKFFYAGSAVFIIAVVILALVVVNPPSLRTTAIVQPDLPPASRIVPAADPGQDRAANDSAHPTPPAEAKSRDKNIGSYSNRRKNRAGGNRAGTKKNQRVPALQVTTTDVKRPADTKKVLFEFSSTPAGAMVSLDGRQLGRTPFNTEFAKEVIPVVFSFRLKGYQSKEVTASLARDREITAQLVKKASSTKIKVKQVKDKIRDIPRRDPDRIDNADSLNERVDELKDF